MSRAQAGPCERGTRRLAPLLVSLLLSCVPLSNDDVAVIETWLAADYPDSIAAAEVENLGRDFWKGKKTREYLRDALLFDSTSAGYENLRHRFMDSYRRIPAPETPADSYVDFYLNSFIAVYQARAATSLSGIGGDGSVQYLREALERSSLSSDVRIAVLNGLAEARLSRFQGTVSPETVGVLDTVILDPGGAGFDGDEDVLLPAGPFPDDVLTGPGLAFVVAAPLGTHRPLVTGVGPGGDTVYFDLPVTSIRYRAHPPESAVPVFADSLPRRFYSVLSGQIDPIVGEIVRDPDSGRELGSPIDNFQVRGRSGRYDTVTAEAEWRGRSALQAVWTPCDDGTYDGPARLMGYVLGRDSRPLAGAVLQIYVGASSVEVTTSSSGFFDLVPPGVDITPDSVRISHLGYGSTVVTPRYLSRRDRMYWVDGFQPDSIPSSTTDTTRRRHATTAELSPGSCRLLKLLKLDGETDYVIVRLKFSFASDP